MLIQSLMELPVDHPSMIATVAKLFVSTATLAFNQIRQGFLTGDKLLTP